MGANTLFDRFSGNGPSPAVLGDRAMKKTGRPSKNGVVEPECFLRAVMVIHAFSESRARGQKHGAAIREAVEFVRQLAPEISISETEVKRVLAEFRPKNIPVALKVDYSILEGEEAAKRRRFLAESLDFAGNRTETKLTDQPLQRPLRSFSFGFGKRPNFPRHNAKTRTP